MEQRFLINQALVQAQIDLIKQYEENRHGMNTKACPMCKIHYKIVSQIVNYNDKLINYTTYINCSKCINTIFTSHIADAGCVFRLVDARPSREMSSQDKEKMLHYHNLVLQWMYKNAGKWLSIDDLQVLKDFDTEAYNLHDKL